MFGKIAEPFPARLSAVSEIAQQTRGSVETSKLIKASVDDAACLNVLAGLVGHGGQFIL
jgi:hypothetical protein